MAPLIAIHSAVDLARLRCLLDLFSLSSADQGRRGDRSGVAAGGVAVCLIQGPRLAMALQARRRVVGGVNRQSC